VKENDSRSSHQSMKLSVEPSAFARIAKTFTLGLDEESSVKDKDLFAFQKEGEEISKTMAKMAKKLEEVDKESDPRKRVDVSHNTT
jgi:hypothetical protein